jgi:hypothetical protein
MVAILLSGPRVMKDLKNPYHLLLHPVLLVIMKTKMATFICDEDLKGN